MAVRKNISLGRGEVNGNIGGRKSRFKKCDGEEY